MVHGLHGFSIIGIKAASIAERHSEVVARKRRRNKRSMKTATEEKKIEDEGLTWCWGVLKTAHFCA